MSCPICGGNCRCKKRGPGGICCHWLEAAPHDETARRDYFVRLLTILSHKVGKEVMAEAIRAALEVSR